MPARRPARSPAKGLLAAALAALLVVVLRTSGLLALDESTDTALAAGQVSAPRATAAQDDEAERIHRLFSGMRSGVQVEAGGEVVHLLPADTRGDRHQLFLVELANGLTLKLSHNVDVAPQIPLEVGDRVRFFGEYEWNERGGLVHWTHRNTRGGPHPGGWVLHEGRRYE